jgi:hypothetical protein
VTSDARIATNKVSIMTVKHHQNHHKPSSLTTPYLCPQLQLHFVGHHCSRPQALYLVHAN